MKLYRTSNGWTLISRGQTFQSATFRLDQLFAQSGPEAWLQEDLRNWTKLESAAPVEACDVPPIDDQEVWAAGVTYRRSRTARMEESEEAGGSRFYDLVYEAERPELFLKATARRVVGHGAEVAIRRDSKWNVPEPELTVAVNRQGKIFGYTMGNDMSSRDIEGENPLYLPQAKVYARCCALGPCLVIGELPAPESQIDLTIERSGSVIFEGSVALDQLKRKPQDLVDYLFREDDFPVGCYLMTGTGIVPDAETTLEPGDLIRIHLDPVGTLQNRVRHNQFHS
jgi:2-dehydro-3-deoxy-D-arabinonate dehydratase